MKIQYLGWDSKFNRRKKEKGNIEINLSHYPKEKSKKEDPRRTEEKEGF